MRGVECFARAKLSTLAFEKPLSTGAKLTAGGSLLLLDDQ
jgi:hypothetical protein